MWFGEDSITFLPVAELSATAPCLLQAGGCPEFPVTDLCSDLLRKNIRRDPKQSAGKMSVVTSHCSTCILSPRMAQVHPPRLGECGQVNTILDSVFYTWETRDRAWWCTLVILALWVFGRLRQEDDAFEHCLGYITGDCLKSEKD